MERELKIGQHVVFIDADRVERDALVLAIHGNPKGQTVGRADGSTVWYWPCVNLVVVDKNEGAKDQYGRQTIKDGHTSIVHWTSNSALGFCYRFADEVMDAKPEPTIS